MTLNLGSYWVYYRKSLKKGRCLYSGLITTIFFNPLFTLFAYNGNGTRLGGELELYELVLLITIYVQV